MIRSLAFGGEPKAFGSIPGSCISWTFTTRLWHSTFASTWLRIETSIRNECQQQSGAGLCGQVDRPARAGRLV
jgi:hypothetical protein